jgi:Reverse transcriptase (RNA-dependent DNA polymerase)
VSSRVTRTLIIYKALYGLKSSGKRWHEKLYDTLRDMGFVPSKADSDVWMRKDGDFYEYIAVYADDLAIASRNPKKIVETLESAYKFKLKGVGPISYHLGCDFYRDPDGTLCCGPKQYIEKMLGA